VFVVAGLLLVGVLVAAVAVSGLFSAGEPREESILGRSGGKAALAVVGGIVLMVVLVLVVVGGIDLPGGIDEEGEEDLAPEATPPSDARLGPSVRLVAAEPDPEGFPTSYEGVDGLEPNTVLQVSVVGFPAFAEAQAWQCVSQTNCGNPVAVQFGDDGTAAFQYLVVDDFVDAAATGRCRPGAAPCSIVVQEIDGDSRAEEATVFHDELPPPGRIRVSPNSGLVDGQEVTVEVEGYPAGASVDAMLCVAPAATGGQRCGPPGPTSAITVGPDGTGRTTLVIRAGPVGDQRLVCGPGSEHPPCGVSVASSEVFARAPVVTIDFAAPPGVTYESTRLAVGLGVAALMLALAGWLIRRTDWSPIGEEAAPEIDAAAYADLDALVASLPEDESEMAGARSD
jgi:hypothetical protein